MGDASNYAKRKLIEASQSRDAARRLSLALATAAAGVSVLLVVALLDYWLLLPMTARLGGTVLLAFFLGAGLHQFISTLRRPTKLKESALEAEALKPELGCDLSTAAEYLSGDRRPTQAYEADLAAALQEKAARDLAKIQLPYWNKLIRPALLLASIVVGIFLFMLLSSGSFTALKRAALPWSNAAYTKVSVQPGDLEIPVGGDIEVKSIFSGRTPARAQFEWQDQGNAEWQFASLKRNELGEYIYPIKNVRTPLLYRVTGSDAVSAQYRVQTYIPPEVKEWRVELAFPPYTKLKNAVQTEPDIAVLRGTKAILQIVPSSKLASARLRFDKLNPIDLNEGANGLWTADIAVTKDADYWIELTDAKGHRGGNQQPFHLKALPDATPKVEIPEPGQDLRAEGTNRVPVKITATDDYGIQELRLVYHRLGGPEKVIAAKRNGSTNAEFTAEIPLAELGLKENELVAFHAEATDNNTLDGPGVGKSDVFFVEITNEEGGTSKSQGKGQKVNLLVVQKQIIADTTALAATGAADKMDELAKRQKDAAEFGKLYLDNLAGAAEAHKEMAAALASMQRAQTSLEAHNRAAALPPEEDALARLYNVLKLMPELKDLPTTPPPLAQKPTNQSPVLSVVLDAIKMKKKEDPDNKELAEALKQAEALKDAQNSLILGSQNSGSGKGSGEVQLARASDRSNSPDGKKGQEKTDPKDGEGKKGEGKKGDAKGNGKGEGKGDGQGEGKGDGQNGEQPGGPKPPEELAQKEEALSKEAAALAEKLGRLAGKDARLGHSAGKKMKEAAAKMGAAAQAMGLGDMQKAGTQGAEGAASIESAIALLEAVVNNRPGRTDVSKEDFPKEYETAIADYLKKLSYEE